MRCKFYEAIVELKGLEVKLFFCKTSPKRELDWLIIIEILTELAEYMNFELDFLLEHILTENEKLMNLINLKSIGKSA